MASYKCKKCDTRNPIPKEWIELGINRIVSCVSCGHKMNLNLAGASKPKPQGTEVVENSSHRHKMNTPTGTVIDGMSSNSSNKYKLEIITGKTDSLQLDIDALEEVYQIFVGRNPETKVNINRNEDAVWLIDDPYVSRLHCQITITKRKNTCKFILKDCKSANGTIVNQNKLEEGDQVLLNTGDQIEIGDTKIRLKRN